MGARARSHHVSIVFEVIRDFGCDPRRVPPFLKTKNSRTSGEHTGVTYFCTFV